MSWTAVDIDALKTQIVQRGFVRSMTFSDQSITFDSIDDMLRLLAAMEGQVPGSRTRYAATRKGA